MKKLFLTIAILLAGVAVAQAGYRKTEVPEAQDGQPVMTSDYAGYDICRTSFTTNGVFCSSGELIVAGMIASSSSVQSDFVIFRDTDGAGSSDTNVTEETFRVYFASGSVITGGVIQNGTNFRPPGPVRHKKGLVIKTNSSVMNMVTVLYHRISQPRAGETIQGNP